MNSYTTPILTVLKSNFYTPTSIGLSASGNCIYPAQNETFPEIQMMVSPNQMTSRIEQVVNGSTKPQKSLCLPCAWGIRNLQLDSIR
jgi:hypothetical protein